RAIAYVKPFATVRNGPGSRTPPRVALSSSSRFSLPFARCSTSLVQARLSLPLVAAPGQSL
ncbi:MAG TPA: hypothetical protein VE842_14135, partial [Pyrinomonadaceae bacterium]|nr:hypothetical protein [Pyrinomonadaceae bacterium]